MQIKNYNHKDLFQCKIIYSPKRRRSLCISVGEEGVIVRVPMRTSDNAIVRFITEKEQMVLRNLKKFAEIQDCKNTTLIERETLHFLGEKYFLKISQSKLLKSSGFCEIVDNYFCVNLPHTEDDEIFEQKLNEAVRNWYKKRALEIFNERTEHLANLHGFDYRKVKIGEQKTLWGSCTHENNLSFNWKVIQCHIGVIDYLIIHELTHTIHKDHSRKFWAKVEEILPNYKELKKELKRVKLISI